MSYQWDTLKIKYAPLFLEYDDEYMQFEFWGTNHLGWFNIVETLLQCLHKLDCIRIKQIKEKWGCLRIYTETSGGPRDLSSGGPRDLSSGGHFDCCIKANAYCDFAMDISSKTCTECGKPATIQQLGEWHIAMCPECLNKNQIIAKL